MDMQLIQHTDEHCIHAPELLITLLDLTSFHSFPSGDFILNEIFPVFELLMRERGSISEAPNVLPSKLSTFEGDGLAYCDDFSQAEASDWFGIGIALGSRSNGKNAGAIGTRDGSWGGSGGHWHNVLSEDKNSVQE
jgi:hypothetical protein